MVLATSRRYERLRIAKIVHFEIGNVFRALTGTRFVPIFAPNMSGMTLALNFVDPTPPGHLGRHPMDLVA